MMILNGELVNIPARSVMGAEFLDPQVLRRGPQRIQRRRTKGWKMPPGVINCTRPGKWGNPFKIGGWYKVGHGEIVGFMWLEAFKGHQDASFTLIETPAQSVEFYRRLLTIYPPKDIEELRGKDLACWCALGAHCHVDVLLELANRRQQATKG